MNALITILTGIVTLIGAAIPVYFKWKKYKKAQSEKVTIASDNSDHDAVAQRLRERLKNVRESGNGDEEKQ
jgi:hypothetical protein